MSQDAPRDGSFGSPEGEIAGLALALQHALGRREAMGTR